MAGNIIVSLPAQPEYLHILRSVVASAAASMDFSIDAIDDLRLVVDEACGQVLAFSTGANALTLTIVFVEGGLELKVATDGTPTRTSKDQRDSMAWTILSALSDSVELGDTGSPEVRMTKASRRAS